jgi:hypothetical protein
MSSPSLSSRRSPDRSRHEEEGRGGGEAGSGGVEAKSSGGAVVSCSTRWRQGATGGQGPERAVAAGRGRSFV